MQKLGYSYNIAYLCIRDSDNDSSFLYHLMFYVCKDNKKVWIKWYINRKFWLENQKSAK